MVPELVTVAVPLAFSWMEIAAKPSAPTTDSVLVMCVEPVAPERTECRTNWRR